jgi:Cu(I)/Ag(I) efflux system membrane protein CusA/SilA
MSATGRGADVARAMALPVFAGMLIELVSLFVVPVLYCGYMEARAERAAGHEDSDRIGDAHAGTHTCLREAGLS